jgi:hypothetical protein
VENVQEIRLGTKSVRPAYAKASAGRSHQGEFILFQDFQTFGALKNESSLDFLDLFDQAKRS